MATCAPVCRLLLQVHPQQVAATLVHMAVDAIKQGKVPAAVGFMAMSACIHSAVAAVPGNGTAAHANVAAGRPRVVRARGAAGGGDAAAALVSPDQVALLKRCVEEAEGAGGAGAAPAPAVASLEILSQVARLVC